LWGRGRLFCVSLDVPKPVAWCSPSHHHPTPLLVAVRLCQGLPDVWASALPSSVARETVPSKSLPAHVAPSRPTRKLVRRLLLFFACLRSVGRLRWCVACVCFHSPPPPSHPHASAFACLGGGVVGCQCRCHVWVRLPACAGRTLLLTPTCICTLRLHQPGLGVVVTLDPLKDGGHGLILKGGLGGMESMADVGPVRAELIPRHAFVLGSLSWFSFAGSCA
jgi:hypothetical protein